MRRRLQFVTLVFGVSPRFSGHLPLLFMVKLYSDAKSDVVVAGRATLDLRVRGGSGRRGPAVPGVGVEGWKQRPRPVLPGLTPRVLFRAGLPSGSSTSHRRPVPATPLPPQRRRRTPGGRRAWGPGARGVEEARRRPRRQGSPSQVAKPERLAASL